MASYEKMVDFIQDQLTAARKTATRKEIKLLENRLRVAKARVPNYKGPLRQTGEKKNPVKIAKNGSVSAGRNVAEAAQKAMRRARPLPIKKDKMKEVSVLKAVPLKTDNKIKKQSKQGKKKRYDDGVPSPSKTSYTQDSNKKKEDDIVSKAVDAVGGVLTGVAKGISDIVSGDFKSEKPNKFDLTGRAGSFSDEDYTSSDPRAMNPDIKYMKKGGKVKSKKKPKYTKKYAMNRGGKVASIRKPTRA